MLGQHSQITSLFCNRNFSKKNCPIWLGQLNSRDSLLTPNWGWLGLLEYQYAFPLFLALAIHLTTGSYPLMPTSKNFQPSSTHRTACTACVAASLANVNTTRCLACSNASIQRHRTTSMSLQPQKSRASTSSTASRALADLGLRRRRSTTGKNIGAGIGRVPSTSGSGPGSVPIPALPSTKTKEFGGAVKGMSNVVCVIFPTPLVLGWIIHLNSFSSIVMDARTSHHLYVTGMPLFSSISILLLLFLYFIRMFLLTHFL